MITQYDLKILRQHKINPAVYAGSFDPITNGHFDLIRRMASIGYNVNVVVANNPNKSYMFTPDERVELVRNTLIECNILALAHRWDGLIVDFCRKNNIFIIIRGIRNEVDFREEINLARINRVLSGDTIETVFVPPNDNVAFISSSYVKTLAALGRDVHAFVPDVVNDAINKKLRKA